LFLGPLVLAGALIGQAVHRKREFLLGARTRVWFVMYVLVFFIACHSDLLVWNRSVTGFESKPAHASRSWLLPSRLGDWRYWLVPKTDMMPRDLVIVTMSGTGPRTLVARRQEVLQLLALAAKHKAHGIAFDFYFKGRSPLDEMIVTQVKSGGTEVVFGYTGVEVDGEVIEPPEHDQVFTSRLTGEQQGHLLALRDRDRLVRLIPLYFGGKEDRPSLSLQVARHFPEVGRRTIAPDELLRFLRPAADIREISYEDLKDPGNLSFFRDRWVLVGARTDADAFDTPFGRKPGVLIHAWAIQSLRSGYFLRRLPWWFGLVVILLSCYIIFLLAEQRASRRCMVRAAGILSALIVAASVAVLYLWLIWFDIIYALAAVWVLVLTVLCSPRAMRKLAAVRKRATGGHSDQPPASAGLAGQCGAGVYSRGCESVVGSLNWECGHAGGGAEGVR
jgi:CHASE2 domain-containing sensor protein